MLWWAWLLVGFLLVFAELLTPGGFYLLFFGLAGIVVGLLGLAGVVAAGLGGVAAVHRPGDRRDAGFPQAAARTAAEENARAAR